MKAQQIENHDTNFLKHGLCTTANQFIYLGIYLTLGAWDITT